VRKAGLACTGPPSTARLSVVSLPPYERLLAALILDKGFTTSGWPSTIARYAEPSRARHAVSAVRRQAVRGGRRCPGTSSGCLRHRSGPHRKGHRRIPRRNPFAIGPPAWYCGPGVEEGSRPWCSQGGAETARTWSAVPGTSPRTATTFGKQTETFGLRNFQGVQRASSRMARG